MIISSNKQQIDAILLQGTHFWNMHHYFPHLHRTLFLFALFSNNGLMITEHNTQQKIINSIEYLIHIKGDISNKVFVRESRNYQSFQIAYTFSSQQFTQNKTVDPNLIVTLTAQSNQSSNQKNRIIINISWQKDVTLIKKTMPELCSFIDCTLIWKQNYCEFGRINQICLPFQPRKGQKNSQMMTLLLGQNNMKELLFFKKMIEQLKSKGKSIDKIIGHPSSILLVLLIDLQPQFGAEIDQLLIGNNQNCRKINRTHSLSLQPQNDSELIQTNLKNMFLNVLNQQNLLDTEMSQFIVNNIVNEQFTAGFIQIIILYYRIFLGEQLSKSQIQSAIKNQFYFNNNNQSHTYLNYFTSLLQCVQFKHTEYLRKLVTVLETHLLKKTKRLSSMTLKDLYNYKNIEFTFIGLDITDHTLRFFNHITTPNFPVHAILSLVQALPTPYKSIRWQKQWGQYHIYFQNCLKLIDLTTHQIIDSRFLINTPNELLRSQTIRKRYFQQSQSWNNLESVSANGVNAQNDKYFQELKTVLKSMKSNAIDSIPKLKMIWKIITTTNQIDVDFNRIDSFTGIPLLRQVLHLDQTYKEYLQHLNREAFSNSILCDSAPIFYQPSLTIVQMKSSLDKLIKVITKFQHQCKLQDKNDDQKIQIINELKAKLLIRWLSWDEMMGIVGNVKVIFSKFKIINVRHYQLELSAVLNSFGYGLLFDGNKGQSLMIKFLDCLIKSQLEVAYKGQAVGEHQTVRTSTLLRQPFKQNNQNYQAISQNITYIKQQLKKISNQLLSYDKQRNIANQQKIRYQYCQVMYKASVAVNKILQGKRNNKEISQLRSEWFQVTPQLYLVEALATNINTIPGKLNQRTQQPKQIHIIPQQIHIILKGQPATLLHQTHQMFALQNAVNKQNKIISTITASNFHSLLAVLYCLDISPQLIAEEVCGLQELIISNYSTPKSDQNIDIVDLLGGNCGGKEQLDHCKRKNKITKGVRAKLLRKYQNLDQLLNQIEYKLKQSEQQLQQVYRLIQHYDLQQEDEDLQFKSAQIINYLQSISREQQQRTTVKQLLQQNKKMIRQKIILNKIGIQFIIRFIFRDNNKEANWLQIHSNKYRSLTLYKQHLLTIFQKYGLASNLTLAQFCNNNPKHVQLQFVLINQTALHLQVIHQQNQPHLQLIDLLLAAVSLPVDFPSHPLPTRVNNKSSLTFVIHNLQHKLTPHLKNQRYWSNHSTNSSPFHLLDNSKQTLLCLQTSYGLNQYDCRQSGFRKIGVQNSSQVSKVSAIDLLSIWWTKSKKLTAKMKQILFGSIFNSPFLRYYYFIQHNSSNSTEPKCNIANLCGKCYIQEGQLMAKRIIANQTIMIMLRVTNQSQHQQIQIIVIPENIVIYMQENIIEQHKIIVTANQQIACRIYLGYNNQIAQIRTKLVMHHDGIYTLSIIQPKPYVLYLQHQSTSQSTNYNKQLTTIQQINKFTICPLCTFLHFGQYEASHSVCCHCQGRNMGKLNMYLAIQQTSQTREESKEDQVCPDTNQGDIDQSSCIKYCCSCFTFK